MTLPTAVLAGTTSDELTREIAATERALLLLSSLDGGAEEEQQQPLKSSAQDLVTAASSSSLTRLQQLKCQTDALEWVQQVVVYVRNHCNTNDTDDCP